MFSHHRITKSLTIGLAAAAVAAPSALAGPPQEPIVPMTAQEQQVIASRGQGSPVPDPVVSTEPQVAAADDGFDWGSAAIGAGAAGGLAILVAVGALGLADHRRVRIAR